MNIGGIFSWTGWSGVSAITTVVTSIGIVVLIYQFLLQKKEYSLTHLQFLMGLANSFAECSERYRSAWQVLNMANPNVNSVTQKEFNTISGALEDCYKSASFIYRIARLIELKLIDSKILYLFFYDDIVAHISAKLSFLSEWSDTGLDLAANYEAQDITRMITPIKELLINMENFQPKHKKTTFVYHVDHLEKLEK
ncbi:MAG: hypothetical protein ABI210_11160, partial [Abditibacteriaceae bacterium]